MHTKTKIFSIAAVGVALAGAAGVVQATQRHQPEARITMAQARATALEAAPGDVLEAEYENENGGWRYSFDIRQDGRIHEIGVDAQSGAIVENVWESAQDEADEAEEPDEMDDEDDGDTGD